MLVLVTLWLCSAFLVAPVVGGGSVTAADEAAEPETAEPPSFEFDPALESMSGTVEVVVRLTETTPPPGGSSAAVRDHLSTHAETTQVDVIAYANETPGVTVENSFWLTNAVVLAVDTDRVDLETLGAFDAVHTIHANLEVAVHDGATATAPLTSTGEVEPAAYDTTYGIEAIDATAVWEAYETQGVGTRVAVLDTGIDASHPDLSLYTADATDPTYPGGWAEFDSSGNEIGGSEPFDAGDHGTHVSGTVAGGNASGTWIGVAPEVDLMHGSVLGPEGGTFSSVVGGMQWAVDHDADVISMSLGPEGGGFVDGMIQPIRNAESAGVSVVASIGNDGHGISGTPGNSYDSVGVGAVDASGDVASFSGGQTVVTDDVWSNPPEEWPEEYVVPEIAAPGVAVESAVPGGYGSKQGTSMAAPHVAGAVALFRSVHPDATPDEVKAALYDTAWKPAGEPSDPDTRYGHGIVDVRGAVDSYAPATLEGTVTDEVGDPIESASVSVDGTWTTTTASDGSYDLLVDAGERSVTVDAGGYNTSTGTVTALSGGVTTHDVTLEATLSVTLLEAPPELLESSGNASANATVAVAGADTVSVSLTENATLETDALSLVADGAPESFDEQFEVGTHTEGDPLVVDVGIDDGANGTLELAFTFAASDGAERVVRVGPTAVVPRIYDVGVVADGETEAATALRDDLDTRLSVAHRLHHVDAAEVPALVDEYDAFVALEFDGNETASAQFVDAAASEGVGVLYLGGADERDGLSGLRAATGTPSTLETAPAGDDPGTAGALTVVADRTHPLLAGVAAERESVTLVESATNRTWFDHEGDDLERLAAVTTDGVLGDGGGLALERSQRQVLFTGTPRDGAFTDEGAAVVANAVAYFTDGATYVARDVGHYGVSGEPESALFGVTEPGNVTLSLGSETTVDPANVTLWADGETVTPGDPFAIEASHVRGGVPVNATVAAGVEGVLQLSLEDERGGVATTRAMIVSSDPPATYEGTVSVNGDLARDGLTVRALVDGEERASAPVEGGWFGVGDLGASDGPLEVSGTAGETVEFALENASTGGSSAWAAGEHDRLTLAVAYDEPFANATLEGPAWTLEGEPTAFSVSGDTDALERVDWTADDEETAVGRNVSLAFDTVGERPVTATLTALGGETQTLERSLYVTDRPAITISGTLTGTSPNETTVRVDPEPADWADDAPVDSSGGFAGLGLEDALHHVTLLEDPAEAPPAIATLAHEAFANDTDLGSLATPDWHDLAITVTDDEGAPVENASVAIAPVADTDRHHHALTGATNGSGAFVADGAPVAGLRANDTVTVTVHPPNTDEFAADSLVETLHVNDSTALEVSLASPSSGGGGGGGLLLSPTPDPSPSFTVVSGSVSPETVAPGETVTVEATVENTGGSGEETLTLRADGTTLEHRTLSLETDERRTLTFSVALESAATISLDGVTLGSVTVTDGADTQTATSPADGADDPVLAEDLANESVADAAADENSSENASETTNETAGDEREADSSAPSASRDDGLPGFGVVPALLVLLAMTLYFRRR
ncbi:hypothetical protein GCM10025298_28980 [Natronobiforma cellulositropha]